jgi:hypothetical protein
MKPKQKPRAKLVGADGNIFNVLGIASNALKEAGLKEDDDNMVRRVFHSTSYDHALAIIQEYVDPY